MITVDGRSSEHKISDFSNLEELLSAVTAGLSGRVVTEVLVNNETFSEIYPHQAEDMACEGIKSVELRTVPDVELARDMAGEMGKVARMMEAGGRNVSRLLRNASDTEALELLQDLLDVTRDFMRTLELLRERYAEGVDAEYQARVERMSSLLSEMSEVLENEDWTLLADLLEYEFAPLCQEWLEVSEKLHDRLVKSAG